MILIINLLHFFNLVIRPNARMNISSSFRLRLCLLANIFLIQGLCFLSSSGRGNSVELVLTDQFLMYRYVINCTANMNQLMRFWLHQT